jgi:hypothetical protein
MPVNTLLRIVSLAAVVWLAKHVDFVSFVRLFHGIGFAHYALAFWYSHKQVAHVLSRPSSLAALAGLAAAGTAVTVYKCPDIVIFFGMHHALTESYLVQPRDHRLPHLKMLAAARLIFNSLGYCIILRHDPVLRAVPVIPMLAGLAASFCVLMYYLWKLRRSLAPADFRDQVMFEILGAAMPIASFFVGNSVNFRRVVMYHFIFWFLLPAVKFLRARKPAALTRYILANSLTSAGFWFLALKVPQAAMVAQIELWGFIHITSSYAISSLNPTWIRHLFAVPVPVASSAGIVMKPS